MSKVKERRKQVIELIKQGVPRKEIAKIYEVSVSTIDYDVVGMGLSSRFNEDIPYEQLYQLYIEEGKSFSEIAKIYGCSKGCVKNRIHAAKIPTRVNDYSKSHNLTKKELEKYYLVDKMSQKDIAKEIGRSQCYVRTRMQEYGITARDSGTAQAKKVGFPINESFFYKWTPELAYYLGLMFADGSISSKKYTIKLQLKESDLGLIEKISDLIGYPRDAIKTEINKQFGTKHYAIIFNRRDVHKQLIMYGLVPNKSKVMKFPYVPQYYLQDFIRGYFDGDGSVYITGGRLCISFSCGSLDFITELSNIVKANVSTEANVTKDKRGSVNYSFSITGERLNREFYNFIYTKSDLYMKRKKDIFDSVLC